MFSGPQFDQTADPQSDIHQKNSVPQPIQPIELSIHNSLVYRFGLDRVESLMKDVKHRWDPHTWARVFGFLGSYVGKNAKKLGEGFFQKNLSPRRGEKETAFQPIFLRFLTSRGLKSSNPPFAHVWWDPLLVLRLTIRKIAGEIPLNETDELAFSVSPSSSPADRHTRTKRQFKDVVGQNFILSPFAFMPTILQVKIVFV
jgi:hypothetical protein